MGARYLRGLSVIRLVWLGVLVAIATGCGARTAAVSGPAMPAYETEALAATEQKRPLHVVFSWSLQEPDGRFSGRGATRFQPPERARLDLFGPRGEAYLVAALIDARLELPAGANDAPLPPPALLWAALGVFRPPQGAQLTGSDRNGETTRLQYTSGDERWVFEFASGRLRSAEWTGRGDGRRTVQLEGSASHGLPRQATYRDWPAFRELRLTLDEVNETEGFPSDIFTIGSR
jgi:hypothetical protein